MSNALKLAIVGCGGHARYNLAPLWRDIPEVEPVGACDVNADLLASFAQAFGIGNTYSNLAEMLAEQRPDILIDASWPSSHQQNVLEGTRGGIRAILVEKPFAIDATRAQEMVRAAKSAGVILMEGLMFHYQPQILAVKQRILEGAVGDVRFVRATFSSPMVPRGNWRLRAELGGGAAMDLGCYCVSCIRYLAGAEPLSVSVAGTLATGTEAWETLVGSLHFDSGVTAQFDCGFGWPWRVAYEVVGSEGAILVPVGDWSIPKEIGEGLETSFTLTRGDPHEDFHQETVKVAGVNPYRAQLLDLCNALSNGEPTRLTADDALANMRVIDAIHASAATGRRADIAT